jgi:hypothetical protein|tara:strand:+ start:957 stop:1343 length:387 start_codon:yes stop_codon:yes gene_type:complete
MFDSDYLLYIFYTGRIYKIGLVKTRESLDRRFKQLYKNLFESDPIIRDKIKFCRVYEGMLDVDVKTCEKKVLKEFKANRLPMYGKGITEGFDYAVTLDMVTEAIDKQTRCKLNLLHKDYTPSLGEKGS